MDEFTRVDVELQLESIRCMRVAMEAENAQAIAERGCPPNGREDFERLAGETEMLRGVLRS